MRNFRGFRPYRDMFESLEILPGQTTIVVRNHEYLVMTSFNIGRNEFYRLLSDGITYNALDVLVGRKWHIKETLHEH